MKGIRILFVVLMLVSLGLLVSCKSEEESAEESAEEEQAAVSEVAQFIATAPVLKMDIGQDTLSQAQSSSIAYSSRELQLASGPSVGGCMAWSVRKNAIRAAAVMEELSCSFEYLATNLPQYFVEGTNYFKIPGFKSGGDLRAKIQLDNNTATINICIPNESEVDTIAENARIVASLVGDAGYHVEATWISEYPVDPSTDQSPIRYFEETLDATQDGIEVFSYFDYWKNETDTETCNGTSGESDSTDDTCFLALSGTFYNDQNLNNPYSIMSGNFAEKNNAGVRTVAAVYAHFADGAGQSKYAYGFADVNADVNSDPDDEIWSPLDFNIADGTGTSVNQALPERRTSLPTIDTAWDCQPEGSFIEIPMSEALPVFSACQVPMMEFADITSCTGGDPELPDAIDIILNDKCDPMLSDLSECSVVGQ